MYYFIVYEGKNKIWIHERTGKDIWQNLFEFVLLETGKIIPQKKISESSFFKNQFGGQGLQIEYISPAFSQTLTHQLITCQFVHLNKPINELNGYQSVPLNQLKEYPFPKIIANYLGKARLALICGKGFDGLVRTFGICGITPEEINQKLNRQYYAGS